MGLPGRNGRSWNQRCRHARVNAARDRVRVRVSACVRTLDSLVLACCSLPHTHTVPGFYHSGEDDKESEGKRTYFRVLEVDCSEDAAADKLRDDIFDKVFHNAATRVVVEAPFEEGSDVADLVAKLRENLPNLHFSK